MEIDSELRVGGHTLWVVTQGPLVVTVLMFLIFGQGAQNFNIALNSQNQGQSWRSAVVCQVSMEQSEESPV